MLYLLSLFAPCTPSFRCSTSLKTLCQNAFIRSEKIQTNGTRPAKFDKNAKKTMQGSTLDSRSNGSLLISLKFGWAQKYFANLLDKSTSQDKFNSDKEKSRELHAVVSAGGFKFWMVEKICLEFENKICKSKQIQLKKEEIQCGACCLLQQRPSQSPVQPPVKQGAPESIFQCRPHS